MNNRDSTMIINEVLIQNFKIYDRKKFIFNDSKVILITGANGYGKSTLIDAIEWCLTGDIKRIRNCFDDRNTSAAEKNRIDNNRGIIKNINCKNCKVRVSIKLQVNDEIFEVYREQEEDSLNCNTKLEYATTIKNETKKILDELIKNDEFYSYHICDTHKSYDFLRSSRKELLSLFKDFLKERPNIDRTISNLGKITDKLNDDIMQKSKMQVEECKILEKKSLIEEIKKQVKKLEYPNQKIFEEEITEVDNLDIEGLKLQLENLNISAYNTARDILKQIQYFYENKDKIEKYKELEKYFYENEDEINKSIKKSYYDKDKLEMSLQKIDLLKDKKAKVYGIKTIRDLDDFEKETNVLNEDLKLQIKEIKALNQEYIDKKSVVENMQKGNKIIEALSDIIKGKKGIFSYKEAGHLECPLCGSDQYFSKFHNESDIGSIAANYLKANDSNIANKKIELSNISKKIFDNMESIKKILINIISKKINKENDLKEEFNEIYVKHNNFFQKLKLLNIKINFYIMDEIKKLIEEAENKLENNETIEAKKETLTSIFSLIDIIKDINLNNNDGIKKIATTISPFCNNSIKVSNFDFNVFNKKVLYIKNMLSNEKLKKHEKDLKEWEGKNKLISEDLKNINNKISVIKKIIDQINDTKKQLEKKELESIGPYLFEIFNKIIKHSIVGEIKLERDKAREGGLVLLDNNGGNLINILSQGQLGVLMMSYFFANMFRRSESTAFKTYFVDDITSCLDDMNVLSFIDMIKYLLSRENGVINQIFFSTCDDNLEKLFIHKMKSFEIKGVNFKFNSYANYISNEF
ncbi:AAA family ATPase [Clostridium niameyense]|uniref:AAA family ATPase n=1 Tax=Clostridium niameyense TaxID=1622073 RepID=UPI00067EB422|nr:AAA family ATPase [Clostridium niameyense]